MTAAVDPFHLRVARIALSVAQQHASHWAAGLALIAHGVVDRPTRDVDLFCGPDGRVAEAATHVQNALRAAGIDVIAESDDNGLDGLIPELGEYLVELTAYRDPADTDGVPISLGHLYRSRTPIVLDIGPVMHIDDLQAWKVAALVARAEPRDYVDVAAFLSSRSQDELLAMARRVDPGIEDDDIAAVGNRLDGIPDGEFASYGISTQHVDELRRRFAPWPRRRSD